MSSRNADVSVLIPPCKPDTFRFADHPETIMAVDAAEVGKHWLLVQSLQKCWRFVDGRPKLMRWKTMRQIPATSPESDAFSKELKHRGFSFVGSTVVYAYMQAVNGKWSPRGLFRLSGDPRREEWETKILPELRKFPIQVLIRLTNKSRSMLTRTLAGRSRPRRRNQMHLK